jgi:hypothetical protein
LDGGQHLSDPVAYRRDRRQDQMLQENGYFVLRFLAEDVGKGRSMPFCGLSAVGAARLHCLSPSPDLHRDSLVDGQATPKIHVRVMYAHPGIPWFL